MRIDDKLVVAVWWPLTQRYHLVFNTERERCWCGFKIPNWQQRFIALQDWEQVEPFDRTHVCQNCRIAMKKKLGEWKCRCGATPHPTYSSVEHPTCYRCWLDDKEMGEAYEEQMGEW